MERCSWLNLHKFIPQRDVRKLIYGLLSPGDKLLVWIAHHRNDTNLSRFSVRLGHHCANNGYLDVLKWARRNGLSFAQEHYYAAAKAGQLSVLKWLCGIDSDGMSEYIAMGAADGGQIETLEWLKLSGQGKMTAYVVKQSVRSGQIAALQWLLTHGDALTDNELCYEAAASGQIEMIKWLRQHRGCQFGPHMFQAAAFGGHTETMTWLRTSGCPSMIALESWASFGLLEPIKWAKTLGANMERVMNEALLSPIERMRPILRWLADEGLPDHPRIIEWAQQNPIE